MEGSQSSDCTDYFYFLFFFCMQFEWIHLAYRNNKTKRKKKREKEVLTKCFFLFSFDGQHNSINKF